jgi:hypothetical protein
MGLQSIAIVSQGHPEGLARCLDSWEKHLALFPRSVAFSIFDDTRDAATAARQMEVALAFARRSGRRVFFAGIKERKDFASALSAHVKPLHSYLVHFALSNPYDLNRTTGANRNALALHHLGEQVLSVDDDTLCEWVEPSGLSQSVVVTQDGGPVECWFPAAGEALPMHRHDPLEAIEKAFLPLREGGDFRESNPKDPTWSSRIGVLPRHASLVWCGIAGDSGYSFPTHLFFLKGASRQRLLEDSDTFERVVQSRQLLRRPTEVRLGPGPFFQTTAVGFDFSFFLPPFMPVLRGQDMLFGLTFRLATAPQWIAYLPWAIRHEPHETRRQSLSDFAAAAERLSFHRLPLLAMQLFRPAPAASPQEALAGIGRHFEEVARLPAREFRRICEVLIRKDTEEVIGRLEEFLKDEGPSSWSKAIRTFLEQTRLATAKETYLYPSDLPEGPAGLSLAQKLILDYGQLLQAWPDLLAGARHLRDTGLSLARPLE